MDDLSTLDWASSNATSSSKPAPTSTASTFYPALRPTPSPLASGRNTPLSSQASGTQGFKPPGAKPAQDSFSNLVNFGSAKNTTNLSLREQQERLEADKRRKDDALRRQAQTNYGGQFLDRLGQQTSNSSRTSSPGIPLNLASATVANGATASDDDLFAAFKAETQVDNASYYPPPTLQPSSGKASPAPAQNLNLRDPGAWQKPGTTAGTTFADDDDTFGLSQLAAKRQQQQPVSAEPDAEDDDDLLGDLAKPVDQVRRAQPAAKPEPGKPIEDSDSESAGEQPRTSPSDPFDKAVAQLVDYGFTPENARRGLTESGAGLNVQAAANWLLDDAHRQAKAKAKAKGGQSERTKHVDEIPSSRRRTESPAWQAEGPSRSANRSPAGSDGDFSKTASVVGSKFLSTANTLWKTGQKKVQKAVAEFQQDGSDSSQPKWMRAAQSQQETSAEETARRKAAEVTDEAMMLESGGRPGRKPARPQPEARAASDMSARAASPASSTTSVNRGAVPKWQQSSQSPALDPRSRLSKQAVEEQTSSAYVSPARRRRPQPDAQVKAVDSLPEPDLIGERSISSLSRAAVPPRQAPSPAPAVSRPTPPPRPPPVQRQIPSVSPVALQTSTKHRQDGTAHYKRGDYAAAHTSYTSSIAALPKTHPLVILLLCNRALTALKTGEPRQAVDDSDAAIALLGPGRGEGEAVDLADGSGERRDLRDLYGKALTRKAEALEQMEKWADAGAAWQACVEAGAGGAAAIAGRQRCQSALAPKPKPKPKAAAPAASRPAAKARPRPTPTAAGQDKSSEALDRLRAANQAAEREGEEKFALVDQVDARVAAWRDGKRANLRALLASMEQVLWQNSGWKKVGLHELVIAGKVKIVYMKAIAKTHPDKLPQDASTEVRMIAGTVFATLNEAWDTFKAENGL